MNADQRVGPAQLLLLLTDLELDVGLGAEDVSVKLGLKPELRARTGGAGAGVEERVGLHKVQGTERADRSEWDW